jgi:anti-sigma factor RsiW
MSAPPSAPPPVPRPDDRVSAYLDGKLAPEERAQVDQLIARSPQWRDALSEVTAARDALRGLPSRDAPPGFWEELLAGEAPVVVLPRRFRGRAAWRGLGAAAAAAAVVVAALVVPTEDGERPRRPGPGTDAPAVRRDDGRPVRADNGDGGVDELVDRVLDPFRW